MTGELAGMAWTQCWQLSLLIAVVLVAARLFGHRRPYLAYVLWLVVLAKCLTPPVISSPGSIFSWLRPAVRTPQSFPAGESTPIRPGDFPAGLPYPLTDIRTRSGAVLASELRQGGDAGSVNLHSKYAPGGDWAGTGNSVLTAAPESARLPRCSTSLRLGGAVWILGCAALIAATLFRASRFVRALHREGFAPRPELEVLLTGLCRRLKVGRRVRLLVTSSPVGPAVVGLWRPTIVLPALLVDGRDPSELEPVLAHELIHVRRGDLWTGLVQVLAQGVWWFHPLVWLANRRATRAAESCCDAAAVAELGCDPSRYARSLLEILELKRRLVSVPAFPGLRPVDVTRERLESIMCIGQGCRPRTPWWCWVVMIVAAAATLPGAAFVAAGDEAASAAPEETADTAQAQEVPPAATPLPNLFSLQSIRGNVVVSDQSIHVEADSARIENSDRQDGDPQRILLENHVRLRLDALRATANRAVFQQSSGAEPFREGQDSDRLKLELRGELRLKLADLDVIADAGLLELKPLMQEGESQVAVGVVRESPVVVEGMSELTLRLSRAPELVELRSPGFLAQAQQVEIKCLIPKPNGGNRATGANRAGPESEHVVLQISSARLTGGCRVEVDEGTLIAESIELHYRNQSTAKGGKPVHSLLAKPAGALLLGKASLLRKHADRSQLNVRGERIDLNFDRDEIRIEKPNTSLLRSGGLNFGTGVNSEAGLSGNIAFDESNFDVSGKGKVTSTGKGTIEITAASNEAASNKPARNEMELKVYPVADLIVPIETLRVVVDDKGQEATAPRLPRKPEFHFKQLIELIRDCAAPESWGERNDQGAMWSFETNLSLVVRQTPEIHDRIAELLGALRHAQDLQVTLQLATIRLPPGFAIDGIPLRFEASDESIPSKEVTADEIDGLRKWIGNESTIEHRAAPRLTLVNGRDAELSLPHVRHSSNGPLLIVAPIVAADQSAIRLNVAVGPQTAGQAVARNHRFDVAVGHSLVLDVTDERQAALLGDQPLALAGAVRRRFQQAGRERILVIITPQIVPTPNEEELLLPQ